MSTSDSDIESNNYIIREPTITNTTDISLFQYIFSIKLLIIITILYIPISILDLYYLNDSSCVEQNTDSYFNLYVYLFIDSIYGFALLLFLPIILFIIDLDNQIEQQVFYTISLLRIFTIFIWTIMGTCIFWVLMDNKKCNQNIYYYVYITLIIRYIFGIVFIGIHIENT